MDDRPVDEAAARFGDEEMFADGAGSAKETSKSIRTAAGAGRG
jgi:hypothetical protein